MALARGRPEFEEEGEQGGPRVVLVLGPDGRLHRKTPPGAAEGARPVPAAPRDPRPPDPVQDDTLVDGWVAAQNRARIAALREAPIHRPVRPAKAVERVAGDWSLGERPRRRRRIRLPRLRREPANPLASAEDWDRAFGDRSRWNRR